MGSGGPGFAHPERARARPGIVDVAVRSPHKTLYEVLAVPPTTSSREIRRIARVMRRRHPENAAFHDVCLAEQVLGRRDLRAEYDALLARLRAAKQPKPDIGVAIEGSRPGPSLTERLARIVPASTDGKVFALVLLTALVFGRLC